MDAKSPPTEPARRLPLFAMLGATALSMVGNVLTFVAIPWFVLQTTGSAVALGAMIGGFGAGSLVGAAVFGAVGHRLPRRATLIAGWVFVGLAFWALAAEPSLPLSAAALFVTGLAAGPVNPIIFTVVQQRTAEEMRGRVIGALWAAALAATPFGIVLAGFLLELVGLRPLLMGIAASYLLATLGMLPNPALKEMDSAARDGPGHDAATSERGSVR